MHGIAPTGSLGEPLRPFFVAPLISRSGQLNKGQEDGSMQIKLNSFHQEQKQNEAHAGERYALAQQLLNQMAESRPNKSHSKTGTGGNVQINIPTRKGLMWWSYLRTN